MALRFGFVLESRPEGSCVTAQSEELSHSEELGPPVRTYEEGFGATTREDRNGALQTGIGKGETQEMRQ